MGCLGRCRRRSPSPDANVDGKLDFPVKSFQFEPIVVSKGALIIDAVALGPNE